MKIAIWKTGHAIADTIADAAYAGFGKSECNAFPALDTRYHLDQIDNFDVHIGYGILRGMDEVFRACDKAAKPWFNIDKGYWKPGHYDGYYRVSLRGTQQTTDLDKLEPDYARFEQMGIEILTARNASVDGPALFCPPTEYVKRFFELDENEWSPLETGTFITRIKDSIEPLQVQLDMCSWLKTFNSSVGWEALRQGLPVISDQTHSIVGAYQKLFDKPLNVDLEARRKLFALMSGLQLSLEEIRAGKLWPLMSRLIASSAGMDGKL